MRMHCKPLFASDRAKGLTQGRAGKSSCDRQAQCAEDGDLRRLEDDTLHMRIRGDTQRSNSYNPPNHTHEPQV